MNSHTYPVISLSEDSPCEILTPVQNGKSKDNISSVIEDGIRCRWTYFLFVPSLLLPGKKGN